MDRIPYVIDTTGFLMDSTPFWIDSPTPDGLAAQTGGLNSKFDGYNGLFGG
ncbi:hypothetical protein ACULLL_09690 [Lysinibacillus irui]|uniref:hypothetical protein n=1 Tax=Lysinibacillus irui TaxID=2998077 RepID=UPI0040445B9C